MPNLHRVRIAWSGTLGGPGVSTFHFDDTGGPNLNALKSFFEGVKAFLPTAVVLTYPTSGITIDSGTGQAVGSWSSTQLTATTGTGGGAFSRATGAVVNWKTGIYAGGRELRGKTFLVPLIVGAYSTNGNLDSAAIAAVQSSANTLAGTIGGHLIWSKTLALTAPVASATVPAKVAVLRSRRD